MLIVGKYENKRSAKSSRMISSIVCVCIAVAVVAIAVLAVVFLGKGSENSETMPHAEPEQTHQLQASGEKETIETTQLQSSGEEVALEEQTTPPRLALSLESVEQDTQMVTVTTSYCVLRYPFAFSDIIRAEVADQAGRGELMFYANVNNTDCPMFSIGFDSAGGIPVGILPLSDGTTVSVTAQIFKADESMDPDILQTFYAAQECINDVISSLTDAEGFVPAQ